jgi:hypothetical protein
VVVGVCPNDFGDPYVPPAKAVGDWQEGTYWLDLIGQFCRSRQWPHLIVPAPSGLQMFGRRNSAFYPGTLTNMLDSSGRLFLDPIEDFINADLDLRIEAERTGRGFPGCALFNERIGDGHFSAPGSEVWADSVGRRLAGLLELDRATRAKSPAPRAPRGSAVDRVSFLRENSSSVTERGFAS